MGKFNFKNFDIEKNKPKGDVEMDNKKAEEKAIARVVEEMKKDRAEKVENVEVNEEVKDKKVSAEKTVTEDKPKKTRKAKEVKVEIPFEGVTKEELTEFKVELFEFLKAELSFNEYRLFKGIKNIQESNKR